MADTPEATRDREALLHVVEQLGLMLSEAGLPRMAARVFAYVLAEDADRYTATQLAEGLQVSPAAISGAVRLLVQTGLLGKGRAPGERSDHYRVDDDDVWSAVNAQRLPVIRRWEETMGEAVRELGRNSRGGQRMRQSQAYFRFLSTELVAMQQRWRAVKDTVIAELDEAEEESAPAAYARPSGASPIPEVS